MRYPVLVVYEGDGRLAAQLRPLAEANSWSLREPRRPGACLRTLAQGGPAVLLLRLGRDLERELTLLERASRLSPDIACVVVAEGDHARLAGLAWDLGAAALSPPVPRDRLPDLIAALLRPPESPP